MSFCPAKNMLRLFVCDDGNGHDFDIKQHEAATKAELIDQHRGLMMIHNLASRVSIERNGASLTMDFVLENPMPVENL